MSPTSGWSWNNLANCPGELSRTYQAQGGHEELPDWSTGGEFTQEGNGLDAGGRPANSDTEVVGVRHEARSSRRATMAPDTRTPPPTVFSSHMIVLPII